MTSTETHFEQCPTLHKLYLLGLNNRLPFHTLFKEALMKRITYSLSFGFIICFLVLSLAGCASTGRRYYSGSLRPAKEVALFVTNNKIHVDGITADGQPTKNLMGESAAVGEVVPGAYTLKLRFADIGTTSRTNSETVNLRLVASAGHVYYIFQEYPTPGSWRPVVVDIASDADYDNIKKVGESKQIETDSPSDVRKWVKHYLESERTEVKETIFNTSQGTSSVWR